MGGAALDYLAVVVVIQFGSLYSSKFYWLLLLIPVWGAWTLYQTFKGSGTAGSSGATGAGGGFGGGAAMPTSGGGNAAAAAAGNRKQRRAEERKKR